MEIPSEAIHERRRLQDLLSGRFFWGWILPVLDFALLLICIFVSSKIRLGYIPGQEDRGGSLSYLIFIVCILSGAAISGAYRRPVHLRTLSVAAEFILGVLTATGVSLFLIYVVFLGSQTVSQESRAVLILSASIFLPLAMALRAVFYRIHARLALDRPYLVIGREHSLKEFSDAYASTGLKNPVVSVEVDNLKLPPRDTGDAWQRFDFWNEVGRRFETVILTEPPEDMEPTLIDKLVRMHFSRLPVLTLNAFYSLMWRKVPTLDLSPAWVFEQDFSLAERSYYRIVKRAFDLIVSTLMIIVCLPLCLLIAILIKLDSRGPIFFRQPRVGRNRRVFSILKFRTMVEGAEKGAPYTVEGDYRVTKIGRILRTLRLDEIPQLLNVLSGDMSLIGPRPEWVRLVAKYETEIPFYHLRHLVKPGITGWAQLNYRYGESLNDAMEKLRFDLYYIRFYSPLLDLEIILKTVFHVLTLRGR